ncbi:phosphoribosylamine--glycine ligase [Helicobacter cappadocius]|uniref:Phosphoribosylamine--glycine ligase n=1 Tax=Helicobacter cappadocius TaxID=3063998 RepID=A0AA90PTY9_9HELI|nr:MULTISPECIES: phosphoribosylamine--glycine ligase [unclassified Helicobacter]MDO7253576.1 phosphoribosylamine--glycine ligase [Helicobacter sp. faydin-H75]MDP2539504.1 phosphoribosylamine--glycine ligase [Helicobacter sp. faydin-H76]
MKSITSQKILIIGNGGREYAIGRAFSQDSRVDRIYFYPGNGGTNKLGENISVQTDEELIRFILSHQIDFVFIGPEAPLVEGMSDVLREAGIKVFGPSSKAAQLEGSKAFMKDFVSRFGIPTARYLQTSHYDEAREFIISLTPPIVLKADGLCAGKGVVIVNTHKQALEELKNMLEGKSFGEAARCVVIEEFLDGYELSVFALCDGEEYVLLPASQDHKRLLSADRGPNTGGMGAYAPTPLCDEEMMKKIENLIIKPTLKGMQKEKMPFYGVLFAGIMVVSIGDVLQPYLLEFNVRFGDPECEILLPLLKTPLLDLCYGVMEHKLGLLKVEISQRYCVGVVIASQNYPYSTSEAKAISINDVDENLGHICFAGVNLKDGILMATGGRVLVCVGVGESLKEARKNAYALVGKVHFDGMNYRDDIGFRALKNV